MPDPEETIFDIQIDEPFSIDVIDEIKPHYDVVEPTFEDLYDFNNTHGFLYIPSIPEYAFSEFEGLYYEGVTYSWAEVDYRMNVDYPAIPEPATYGLVFGFIVLLITMIKRRNK